MVQRVTNRMTPRSPHSVPRLLWALIAMLALGAAAAIAVVTQPADLANPNGETVSREAADLSPGFRASLDDIASSRAQVAEAARLQGLADSVGVALTRSQVAEAARLQGLADSVGVALTRSQVAEAARLQGLADSVGVALTRSQVAEAARLQGLAERSGVTDG